MIKKINKYVFFGFLVSALAFNVLSASTIDDSNTTEHLGFFVRGMKICHQGEWRNLSVTLEYESDLGSKATDVQSVKAYLRGFLESYPNTTDFWEIMNRNLIRSLTQEFPGINTLKTVLDLAPDKTLSFHRQSIVQYEKGAQALKESFGFTKPNYLICNDSFRFLDLHVLFTLKDNPDAFDFPDYQWVDQAMERFFAEHPVSFSKWKDLKPQLEAYLLTQFPTLTWINIEVTVAD